ncbi:carbohydrate ABC transporter permease [Massiliimalia massiliensis]|uniref:carbohydrate ABC transporter permease n=1 Tax=Massiliimalia massiliensis TaxID=1852384 RepID=UPI000985B721|nr:carbohydrate ABC transporter permease [Massiliimalia massiliensis]
MTRTNRINENGYSVFYRIRIGVLKVLINLILYFLCLTYIFPFLWLFYNSLKDRKQFSVSVFALPNPPTLYAYKHIFSSPDVYRAIFNSVYNTLISLVLIVSISFVLAYFLSRYHFKGRRLIYGFFLVGMMIPIHALLIPLYIEWNSLNMTNSYFALLPAYVTFALPMAIYLYDSYMKTVPRSIEEAAFVDGASVNYIMTHIMFPICRPITSTVLILNFMSLWNEFSFALVLNSKAQFRTIPVWLTTFQGQYSGNMPVRITAMLIGSLPIIIMYIFFREKMMEGMAAGAVKG